MSSPIKLLGLFLALTVFSADGLIGCKASGDQIRPAGTPAGGVASPEPLVAQEQAPPPSKTGGFDGQRAYDLVARQVSFGPHPSGSPAIAQVQEFLQAELKSYGCRFEVDSFSADTPAGRLQMKNILVKIPGEKSGVILLGTHYDTKLLEHFVGADDGGSSTGVMLELARQLCPKHGKYAVWVAFFDGEEAVRVWSDSDSRYGSRQMAARFATSGDLPKIKAFLLADIVGGRTARFQRESNSTPALVDLVWNTSARLGYSALFSNEKTSAEDDHDSFLKRGVPSVDVIGDFLNNGYWHTPQDSLDKISPGVLASTGHVFLESVKALQTN